MNITVHVPKLT